MAKKAPILVHTPHPKIFKTTYEEEKYWASEQQKYVEGVGSIPGSYYYFMQNCVVKDRVSGALVPPESREVDLLMHEFVALQRKNKRHGGILKGRGVGLSTQMGALCNYFIQINPGSNCLVTSKSQKGTKLIFEDKILPIYNNLHPSIQPVTLNINKTNQSSYIKLGTRVKSKIRIGETEVAESNIICSETSENPKSPQNFSGLGAIFGAMDEFALHPRREQLLDSSIECFRNTRTKENEGMILFGGTCEFAPELTGEKLLQFKTFIEDLHTWKADLLFIPYWMQMFTEENNGYPDKKRATEWWQKEWDALNKAKNPDKLTAFIRNNPPDLESIWDTADGDRWEHDTLELIKEQRRIVIDTKPPRAVGNFLDLNQGVEFRPTNQGKIIKLEDPKPGLDYYTVVDGTGTGSETGNESGSNVAAIVIKGFDPAGGSYAPCCLYFERPKTVEQSYINICSMSKYYERVGNFVGIMAEGNSGVADHFSTYLKRVGLQRYIMYARDYANKKTTTRARTPWVYVTNHVRDYQMKEANPFIKRHYASINLLELLDQMLQPASANTDILDAFLMLFLALPPDYDKPPKAKVARKRQIRVKERDANGFLWDVWKDV